MRLLLSELVDVTSLAFGKTTQYLENHPQMPSFMQARHQKDTFMNSKGRKIEVRVSHLLSGKLWQDGQNSLVYSSDALAPGQSFGHVVCSEPAKFANAFTESASGQSHFKNVVFTTHPGTYNFHHFLFELLPVIWLYRDFLAGKQMVIASANDSRFVQELIDLLKIDISIIPVPLKSLCNFEDSLHLDFFPFRVYPTGLIGEIRKSIQGSLTAIGPTNTSDFQNAYLGRGDNSRNRRKILNEDDLIKYLTGKYGEIKLIRPGLSTTLENVRSLVEVKHIFGPTGGALANLIWSRNLESMLEIVPEKYPGDTESFELSKILGFNYYKLLSKSVSQDSYFSNEDQIVSIPKSFDPLEIP